MAQHPRPQVRDAQSAPVGCDFLDLTFLLQPQHTIESLCEQYRATSGNSSPQGPKGMFIVRHSHRRGRLTARFTVTAAAPAAAVAAAAATAGVGDAGCCRAAGLGRWLSAVQRRRPAGYPLHPPRPVASPDRLHRVRSSCPAQLGPCAVQRCAATSHEVLLLT